MDEIERRTIPLVAALAAAAVLAGCREGRAAEPKNVILICMDTVRADHIGCYGYDERPTSPSLDELAARSTVFRDVWATAGWTKPSVPSILTGTFPLRHGVYLGSSKDSDGSHSDVLPAGATTLAEVFAESGYATAAFVRNAQLRRGLGFEQGFELYEDGAGDAREIRWKATDWLNDRGDDRPFFLYLHFLDAHWPYPVPDEYATRFTEGGDADAFRGDGWRELRKDVNDGRRRLDEDELRGLVGLYDGAIRYIDDQLGLLFDELERRGIAEDTVVCVVSDHGEEFLEHDRIGHGHGLYKNLLHVPWILHIPGRGPRTIETPCSLVDLFPTVLAAARVRTDVQTEGVDRLTAPDAEGPILAEHLDPGSYRQAWREGARKTVRRVEHAEPSGEGSGTDPAQLRPGGQWKADIAVAEDGALVALRIRSNEGTSSEETEIKGLVSRLEGETFELNGVRVTPSAETEVYGATLDADGGERAVEPGVLVKVRGGLDDSGLFVPTKIKLYPSGEEVEYEVRGTLVEVDPTGRVSLDGIWIRFDDSTDLEEVVERAAKLSREDVPTIVEGGTGADWELLAVEYDLVLDPGEQAPRETGELSDEVLRYFRDLVTRRMWGAGDRTRLTDDDLQDLRQIGYVE